MLVALVVGVGIRIDVRVVRVDVGINIGPAVLLLPRRGNRQVARDRGREVIGRAVERPAHKVVAFAGGGRGLGGRLAIRHRLRDNIRATCGIKADRMRNRVRKRHRLARHHGFTEGLRLDDHVVGDLDLSALINGALLDGFAAIGRIANRCAPGLAGKLHRLRVGVDAGDEARRGCGHGIGRRDRHLDGDHVGYGLTFLIARIDVVREGDRAGDLKLLRRKLGLVKAGNLVPHDVERHALAARSSHQNAPGQTPAHLIARVLSLLVLPGLRIGKLHVRKPAQDGILPGTGGREAHAQRLAAVRGLGDVGQGAIDSLALAVDDRVLGEYVRSGRRATFLKRERGGVAGLVSGIALPIALRRPSNTGIAMAVGEQRCDIGPRI